MKLGDETRKTARVRVNFSRSINAVDSLPESSQSWADDITERVTAVQSTAEEAKLAAEDANAKVGNLDDLKTDAKDNLVEAINEAAKSGLPTVTAKDDGKVLTVENGAWAVAEIPSASGVSF